MTKRSYAWYDTALAQIYFEMENVARTFAHAWDEGDELQFYKDDRHRLYTHNRGEFIEITRVHNNDHYHSDVVFSSRQVKR